MPARTHDPSHLSVVEAGQGLAVSDAELITAGLWLRVAGGKLAVQYLERAGQWVADVDPRIVNELDEIRHRLLSRLSRLEELKASQAADEESESTSAAQGFAGGDPLLTR